MSSAEDGDVQRAEKRLAHGTPDVNEKLSVDKETDGKPKVI